MSRTRPVAFFVSFGAHAALFFSLGTALPSEQVVTRRPVEMELRPVQTEARRAPALEKRPVTSDRPRSRVAVAPEAPVAMAEETTVPPPADEEGDEDEEDESSGGSGAGDDDGVGPPHPSPPPVPDMEAEVSALPHVAYPDTSFCGRICTPSPQSRSFVARHLLSNSRGQTRVRFSERVVDHFGFDQIGASFFR